MQSYTLHHIVVSQTTPSVLEASVCVTQQILCIPIIQHLGILFEQATMLEMLHTCILVTKLPPRIKLMHGDSQWPY